MWRFIFSGILILVVIGASAQEITDFLLEDERSKFGLRSFQVNYNVLRLTENLLNKPKTSQEFQAELGIHERYFLVADIGFAETNRGETYSYQSKGTYWRTGIDVNMSKDPNTGNMIGVGIRYAQASFEDNLFFTKKLQDQDGVNFTQKLVYSNPNLSAAWAELVFKMRVKVWKKFYAGYTMRYQVFLTLHGASDLKPFDIPGYGKTTGSNSFGFDYYLGWRLKF